MASFKRALEEWKEPKTLTKRARNTVKALQGQKTGLAYEIDIIKKEKQRLEGILALNKLILEHTLSEALVNLKQQRPDLFTISNQEQIAKLVVNVLRMILS